MISKWFKNKNNRFPGFWNDYVNLFSNKKAGTIEETRFIAFDTETTGFNKKDDRILSIGAISIKNNKIEVNESLELYLEQDVFNKESVKIHGLLKNNSFKKVSEIEAIKIFLKYIKNDVLVAHHAYFDMTMINNMLLRHGLKSLKNEVIDTGTLFHKSKHLIYRGKMENYSLDDLCKELNVPKIDRHTANGDALITGIIFLKTLSRLKKRNALTWDYLTK